MFDRKRKWFGFVTKRVNKWGHSLKMRNCFLKRKSLWGLHLISLLSRETTREQLDLFFFLWGVLQCCLNIIKSVCFMMERYLIACSCPEWLNAKASYTTPCCNDFVTVGLFCRGRWRTKIFINRVTWCSRIFTSNSISLPINSAGFHILPAVHTHRLQVSFNRALPREASEHNTITHTHTHTHTRTHAHTHTQQEDDSSFLHSNKHPLPSV